MVYRGSLVRTSNHALASSAANKHCDALCQVVAQIAAADPTNHRISISDQFKSRSESLLDILLPV